LAYIELNQPFRTVSANNGSGGTIELTFDVQVSGWSGLSAADVATVIKNAIDGITNSTVTSALVKSQSETSF
jgi:hypothetical protein